MIYCSSIVIVDFSGRNPNVFYEAGIAHTLEKNVIPITQSLDDIPFDLRHHRVLKYLNNNEGLNMMENDLEKIENRLIQYSVHDILTMFQVTDRKIVKLRASASMPRTKRSEIHGR